MTNFLRKAFLLSIPLILIVIFLEVYLRNIDTLYSLKLDGLLRKANSIELLILGNSHASYGINPGQFLIPAFNLAQSNQSLYFDKRITLKYIDKLPNLKYVFVSIDFHSLYFSSQGIRDTWSYYNYGIDYKDKISMFSKLSRIFGYSPRVALSFIKKALWENPKTLKYPADTEEGVSGYNDENNGWVYFEGTDHINFNYSGYQARADVFNKTVQNSMERIDNLTDLDDFIYQLKQRDIEPILVQTPCFYEFTRLLNKEVSDRNKSDIVNLTNKYDIQYWNVVDQSFDIEDFYNCDHLNKRGANKFSGALNTRLQELNLREN